MASRGVQNLESAPASAETRTGLEPWVQADLPEAPAPTGLQWAKVVGPGVIVLGLSLGGGEFLLGPTAFVRYGMSLLWITLVAVFFQTIFNTELMRYTVATGEPVFTGFMRTTPGARVLGVAVRGDVPPAGGLAVFSGTVGGSDLLSRHQAHRDAGGRDPHLSARRRDVSALHSPADARAPHRAHPRAAQLGDGRLHPGWISRCWGCTSFPARRGPPPRSDSSDSICRAGRSASCRVTRTTC